MTAQGRLTAGHLLHLSDQIGRIATTLAQLSLAPDVDSENTEDARSDSEAAVAAVRVVIRARQLRAKYFDQELFADPAWDMMLDLFEAELAQRRVSVSSLCIAAAVPPTTALRWLKTMTEKGLVVRHADPRDGRRFFVGLSAESSRALHTYFAKIADARTM